MKQLPAISEAEWEVMKVLWANEPLTAAEVIKLVAERMNWSPKTVRTLLNRLVVKEVVGIEQGSRPYAYHSLVSEETCQREETHSFLKRIYNGAFKPLMVNFLQSENLSEKEIEELKQLLEEKKRSRESR